MPALTPVYIAMNILSPVIIFGYIPDNTILSINYFVSFFNLFSNATNPNNFIPYSNIYLDPYKYLFN